MCFSIYSCAIYCSKDEEEFQEDPEDPDFEKEQEEDLAEGKTYLSLIILNPWFTNTYYRACFKYLYRMFILKHCLVNSYYCYCHSFHTCLTFPLQYPRRSQQQLYCLFGCHSLTAYCLLCFLVDTLAI